MSSAFSVYNAFYLDWKLTFSILQGKGKEKVGDSLPPSPTSIPPAKGFMKLNTDGAWKGIDNAGGGGVIRKENGEWFLGYSTKFNAKTPLAAELLALREGLSLAKTFDVDNLEVETDADSLIFMLDTSTVNPYPHHELVAVIEEVRALMNGSWKLEVRHIPRHKNLVAHGLAAFAMNMAVGHKSHSIHLKQFVLIMKMIRNQQWCCVIMRVEKLGTNPKLVLWFFNVLI